MSTQTPSPSGWPSAYATHADLNTLRQEIKDDFRLELRNMSTQLRADIAGLRHDNMTAASRRQWLITTVVSCASMAAAVAAVWGSR